MAGMMCNFLSREGSCTTRVVACMGRCRWLILEEKSAEERSSGLEAREERMLSIDDFLLGGAREGVRLTPSSAAAAMPVLETRLPAGPYSEQPSSEAWSSCCCTPLQRTTIVCKPCQKPAPITK